MIINLTENRRISSNTYGYSLEKLRVYKDGEKYIAYKYYATLSGLLKGVPEQLLKELNTIGILNVISALEELSQTIKDTCKVLESPGEDPNLDINPSLEKLIEVDHSNGLDCGCSVSETEE